ncbi:MAG TPA: GNAT family N-acetyltransferase [candidate division Zixibacteria bacterium]|nr:GNAT family N-acetyltransferase [candidate division Zixibacteria bacterium]
MTTKGTSAEVRGTRESLDPADARAPQFGTVGTDVTVRPVRDEERPAWIEASRRGYARAVEEQGGFTGEAAARKADEDIAAALARPGSALYVVEASETPVGRLWLAERESAGHRTLFIYDIQIDPAHRGRGYARAAMAFVDEEARRRGIGRIELHVFGSNQVARSLYRSAGYTEVSVLMRKDL